MQDLNILYVVYEWYWKNDVLHVLVNTVFLFCLFVCSRRDSYWIVRGLLLCGMNDTVKGMIRNLAQLINESVYH